ncbi:MAG: hypothetical protein WC943_08315, partial [Elusimicrobiota bacterium]
FACGLFAWLRRVNGNVRAVVFATLVMSVSFKVTELLRFPNAVHAAAWYPWLLCGVTGIMSSGSARQAVLPTLLSAFSLVCLVTAGYPYYAYYVVFLVVPYLAAFAVPALRERLFAQGPVRWRVAVPAMVVGLAVTGALCAPYALAVKDLLDQTTHRQGGDLGYATKDRFTLEDTVGSLVYPPASQAEGWYFFGVAPLLLVLSHLFRRRAVAPSPRAGIRVPWDAVFFLSWLAFITCLTYGDQTPLFRLLWDFLPGFSRLRLWGRLNIVLVVILAWLVSRAYASWEETLSPPPAEGGGRRPQAWGPVAAVALAYGLVLAVQVFLYANRVCDPYWLSHFRHVASSDILFISRGALAFTALSGVLIISRFKPLRKGTALAVVLCILTLVTILELEPVGTRAWIAGDRPVASRARLDLAGQNLASFSRPRIIDGRRPTISLGPDFSVCLLQDWYFDRFLLFFRRPHEPEAVRMLLGMRDGRKVFFSRGIEHGTAQAFLKDALAMPRPGRLVSYTGDELDWEVHAPAGGYLSFIDNWDRHWRVYVDGRPAALELLFGTFKSVRVPAGLHRVRFSYEPGVFSLLRR